MKRMTLFVVLGIAACGGRVDAIGTDPSAGAGGTASANPPETSTGDPGSSEVLYAIASDNQVFLFARDTSGACVRMRLSPPNDWSSLPTVTVSEGWHVIDITRWRRAGECSSDMNGFPDEAATQATGEISWTPYVWGNSSSPCVIDVHVAAVFDVRPEVEPLDADKVEVRNCK
jgi:hypothetical protein